MKFDIRLWHRSKQDEPYPKQLVSFMDRNEQFIIYKDLESITGEGTREVAIYKLVEIVEVEFPPVTKSLKKFD